MFFENKVVYSFGVDNPPVETIEAGETIIIEVKDIFNNQMSKTNQIEEINFDKTNPVTGPFYIHQALPQTMLKVNILHISLDDKGIGVVVEGLGVLGSKVHKSEVYRYSINGENTKMGNLAISLNPFLSIIGVAPRSSIKNIACAIPQSHGGKIDCPHVTVGATVYLPIFNKGGYLALGGLKARQGLGQLAGSGIECSGEIKIKVDVINSFYLNMPIVKNSGMISFLYSDQSLELAIERATNEVTSFLMDSFKISFNEAFHLTSVIGNLEIFQLVNPNITVGISFPERLFSDLGYF